jgi:acetyltransferase-like isoleucine patch superfamily enzyme
VLEIEAETEGYLRILHPEGTEVGVGEVIGVLQPEEVDVVPRRWKAERAASGENRKRDEKEADKSSGERSDVEIRCSRKARALIQEEGIDLAVFAGRSLVREAEVRSYMQSRVEKAAEPESGSGQLVPIVMDETETSRNMDRVEDKAPFKKVRHRHSLWEDARISARERSRGMGWLVVHYFWNNWFLGNLVRWAPRMFILPLHRLRGVKIGTGCFIDPTAVIETAYPENITIGDDVRIGAQVTIMTHIKPPHYLRETGIMSVVVKPVVLENHSFIGVNAVIMPGVTVGRASVVASGAVVIGNVPAFTMVAGNPARIVKRFSKPD